MVYFAWGLLVMAIVALLFTLGETLVWWYLWQKQATQDFPAQSDWKTAIVFLTGISDYSLQSLQEEQLFLLEEVNNHYPVDLLLTEPFPYQTSTAQSFSKFNFWRKIGLKEPPLWVISLHNFWQTVLTIKFEKLYGLAVARCLINRLGFPQSFESKLVLICGSAGAAIALAAVPFLQKFFQTRLIILSYGGVFNATSGLDEVTHFYHLVGERDVWAKLGEMIFPGRWLPLGTLARARTESRFHVVWTGCHQHFGPEGYLSDRTPDSSTQTYRELTVNAITQLKIWEEIG
ncbi:MAG: hypothetical protein ACM37W_14680 [Actinomycetota bacterium]